MRLRFFAWVRERVGTSSEEVESDAPTVRALLTELAARETRYADAFANLDQLHVAVDQELAELDTPLMGAREVAIFPPMTGG